MSRATPPMKTTKLPDPKLSRLIKGSISCRPKMTMIQRYPRCISPVGSGVTITSKAYINNWKLLPLIALYRRAKSRQSEWRPLRSN